MEPWQLPEGSLAFAALVPEGGGPTQLALHHDAEGRLVAVGFSSLDRLIASYGRGQRWLAFAADDVATVLEGSGVTELLVDPDVTWLPPAGPSC